MCRRRDGASRPHGTASLSAGRLLPSHASHATRRAVASYAAVAGVMLCTVIAGCSPTDETAGSDDVALAAGAYVVRSAARFHGDTLTLSNALTSTQARAFAKLVPPDARKATGAYRTTNDTYSGYVNVVPSHARSPGSRGPHIEFNLECHCRTERTDLTGQPLYDQQWLAGRYTVRDIGDGRIELREVPEGGGGSDAIAVDTLERAR